MNQQRLIDIIQAFLLSPEATLYQNQPLIDEMCAILCEVTGVDLNPEGILEDHTPTARGKAVSLVTAGRCAKELMRTQVFIRGVYAALQDQKQQSGAKSRRPVQLLYAGTGPFGLLVIPLLPLFSADEIQVTLLDIHQKSLDCVGRLVDWLGVEDRVQASECTDILLWQAPSDGYYDVLVSETMTATLRSEPQVSIFAHLEPCLKPEGVMIPQEIRIDAWMMAPNQDARANIGRIFTLNRDSSAALSRGDTACLSARLIVPDYPEELVDLEFSTDIVVYGDHFLGRKACSLNLPCIHHNSPLEPGSLLEATYRLTETPEFSFNYKVAREFDYDNPADMDDTGSLGLPYVKRFWQKIQLMKCNRMDPKIQALEAELDRMCYDALGLDFPKDLAEVFHIRNLAEFEQWVLNRNGGSLPEYAHEKLSEALSGASSLYARE